MERRILKKNTPTHFCETGNIIEDVRKQTNTLSMVVSLRYDTSAIKLFVVFFFTCEYKKERFVSSFIRGARITMSSGRGVLDVNRSSSGRTNPSKIRSVHTVRVLLALCVSLFFHLSVTHSLDIATGAS